MPWNPDLERHVRDAATRIARSWRLIERDLEDAVCYTTVNVWRHYDRNPSIASNERMFGVVIRREMIRWLKTNKKRMDHERMTSEKVDATAGAMCAELDMAYANVVIQDALGELLPPAAMGYLRSRIEGYEIEECQAMHGITHQAYYRALARAMKKLTDDAGESGPSV